MTFDQDARTSQDGIQNKAISRREVLKLFVGAGAAAAVTASLSLRPFTALATTQSEIDAAQSKYDEAQAKLKELSEQVSSMQSAMNDTNNKVEDVQKQIDSTQNDIESKQQEIKQKEAEMAEKRKQLGARMSSNYKAGPQGALELLLSSASFEELTSNIYYLDKISESDKKMIADVKALRDSLDQERQALESKKADLENQKASLQTLQADQRAQLDKITAKQNEAVSYVNSLDDQVKQLIAQHDAELLEAQQAAALAAAQQSSNENSYSGGGSSGGGSSYGGGSSGGGSSYGGGSYSGGGSSSGGSGSAAAVVSAANYTGSTGAGMCAAWVSNVFSNAGIGHFYGNACDMYYRWCHSSDQSTIQTGMIIAVASLGGSAAALIYGHVGIYIGGGMVRHNISGVVKTQSLSSWISNLGGLSTPRWGWLGGVALS